MVINNENLNFSNCKTTNDYLKVYLKSQGVKEDNAAAILSKPSFNDIDNPFKFHNMKKAVELTHSIIEEWKKIEDFNARIFTQVDSDVDGFTSSSILLSYLKERYGNHIEVYGGLHEGKEHGLVAAQVDKSTDLVFVPDAGSNDYDEIQKVHSTGTPIIILDHHEITDAAKTEQCGAILINSVEPDSPNNDLCGAGMVLMFIKAYDETYFKDQPIWQDYLDLAALGEIADVMKIDSKGINYILYYGLKNIKNKLFRTLLEKQEHKIKDITNPTKIDVAFYIAPIINGLIRAGRQEEKEKFFQAMYQNNSDEIVTTTYRGVERKESLYEYCARIAINAKARQDAAKKRAFKWLCDKIDEKGLDKHNLLIVPIPLADIDKVDPNFTGLIAMELLKKYNKPTILVREQKDKNNNTYYMGSLRNKEFAGISNFYKFINDSKLGKAMGHPNAAGVLFYGEKLDEFRDYGDKKLDASAFEPMIDVVCEFNGMLNLNLLTAFAESPQIFGTGIQEPEFAFKLSVVKKDIFLMGQQKDSIKINYGGADFVIFKNPQLAERVNAAGENQMLNFLFVGRPSINEWMGKKSLQVMVDDYEIKEDDKKVGMLATSLI